MDLFIPNCYDLLKDEKSKKRAMEIEAIVYRRNKAVESRVKRDMIAIETGSFSKMLERLPEDEQKVILEDARQCAKKQQERLDIIQHEEYLKRHNIYEFLDIKCPVCGNSFTSYQKERFEPTFLKIECNCRKCNKSFYGFEHSDRIELWEERNFAIFSEPKYVIKVGV